MYVRFKISIGPNCRPCYIAYQKDTYFLFVEDTIFQGIKRTSGKSQEEKCINATYMLSSEWKQ